MKKILVMFSVLAIGIAATLMSFSFFDVRSDPKMIIPVVIFGLFIFCTGVYFFATSKYTAWMFEWDT